MSKPPVAVVGGGLSGLVAALLLTRGKPRRRVVVLERADEIGGLHRSFSYPGRGRFDYGAHYLQETKIPEVDEALFGALPAKAWDVHAGPRRDVGGVYYRGALQTNTPFLDLRRLPKKEYEACLRSFLERPARAASRPARDAGEAARRKFGPAIARDVIGPVLEGLYGMPARDVHPFALELFGLQRVALFDEARTLDMARSRALRDALAYPEQRTFPLALSSGKRTFYPKRFGMQTLVDAIGRELSRRRVEVLTGARIAGIGRRGRRAATLRVEDARGARALDVSGIVWSAGPEALHAALGLPKTRARRDAPPVTVFAHFLFGGRPAVADLYNFLCLDPGFRSYRVANYWNYASGARRNGLYPMTVEMFAPREGFRADRRFWARAAESELRRMGVLGNAKAVFSAAEFSPSGFPMCTVANVRAIDEKRARVRALRLENLALVGVLAEPGLFFLYDVLADAHRKLKGLGA